MTEGSERDAAFALHRSFLVGVAYRMLGSVADAEDIVQDAFLRWQRADAVDVAVPRAYLTRVVTRLCLDRLKSARVRREQYVGTWLPEPLVEAPGARVVEDISVALLVTLERLSPLERAAFLLHDVFGVAYGEIAGTLERDEPAVRQLAARGRAHVRDARPRYPVSHEIEERLASAFAIAAATGDIAGLTAVLAEDAVLYTDAGGKRRAALNPIFGPEKIARFFAGVLHKNPPPASVRAARINGLPGFVLVTHDGVETLAVECRGDRITAIYGVRNPDKLRHVPP